MPSFRRTICSLLILAMLLLDLPPVAAFDFGATANGSGDAAQAKETAPIPAFPERDTSSDFDWSSVDWDKPVILPADEEEYVRNVQLLTSQQRFGEIASLKKKDATLVKEIQNILPVPRNLHSSWTHAKGGATYERFGVLNMPDQ